MFFADFMKSCIFFRQITVYQKIPCTEIFAVNVLFTYFSDPVDITTLLLFFSWSLDLDFHGFPAS